ncbi:hypothetical protein [Deinococcus peraridilitoris]|uniref:Uncharacterized protein n=1 Tax=Deinococcus peraridilitoris (strain DSM 19664 / LMG 22246 / CIP 109416 / KR-200) TaxID=937777 RepID=L0A1S8_DEIPD|nr:hypothetical protein [Deinococcus peraridilitoris]AFZ67409.1 hypothetical protein Deipe_1901 [Deinococcus peraridilitoris DSM 19664]
MFRDRLAKVTDFLLTQQENLEKNERAYKLQGAEMTRAHLQSFLDGSLAGKVNVQQGLNLLYWQTVDDLNRMANERPDVFREALTQLWNLPGDLKRADAFWSALDSALEVLPAEQRQHFNGFGTRASVVSYFLFLTDPTGHPFYRPNFAGRAVEWLYDKRDGLDRRSLGSFLTDFVGRCRYLHREFSDARVPLRDMLDMQGALYIISTQYLPDARRRKK